MRHVGGKSLRRQQKRERAQARASRFATRWVNRMMFVIDPGPQYVQFSQLQDPTRW